MMTNNNYGRVNYNGETYVLLEDAYADTLGSAARPIYCASAIREGEQPDELGCVTTYRVTWYVLDEYIEFDDTLLRWRETAGEDVEESELCNWDEPDEIEELDAIPAEEVAR